MRREDRAGRQAIHHVAQAGQISALNFLVQELWVDSDAVSSTDRETPLHAAAKVIMHLQRKDLIYWKTLTADVVNDVE